MTRLFLYKEGRTGATGRRLAKALRCFTQRALESGRLNPENVDKIIRWGSTEHNEFSDFSFIPTLNCRQAIMNASNKLLALRLLDAAGVRVPEFTTDLVEATRWLPTGCVLGRTKFHQGGSNFWYCENSDDIEDAHDAGAQYFMRYIDIHNEWRVHVFGGEVIGISRKTDEGVEDRITDRFARNHENGWRFVRCDISQTQSRLKEIAVEAIEALGLDFGAVDIILSGGDSKRYYVLEVNTAAALEEDSTIFDEYFQRFYAWYNTPDLSTYIDAERDIPSLDDMDDEPDDEDEEEGNVIQNISRNAPVDDELLVPAETITAPQYTTQHNSLIEAARRRYREQIERTKQDLQSFYRQELTYAGMSEAEVERVTFE